MAAGSKLARFALSLPSVNGYLKSLTETSKGKAVDTTISSTDFINELKSIMQKQLNALFSGAPIDEFISKISSSGGLFAFLYTPATTSTSYAGGWRITEEKGIYTLTNDSITLKFDKSLNGFLIKGNISRENAVSIATAYAHRLGGDLLNTNASFIYQYYKEGSPATTTTTASGTALPATYLSANVQTITGLLALGEAVKTVVETPISITYRVYGKEAAEYLCKEVMRGLDDEGQRSVFKGIVEGMSLGFTVEARIPAAAGGAGATATAFAPGAGVDLSRVLAAGSRAQAARGITAGTTAEVEAKR